MTFVFSVVQYPGTPLRVPSAYTAHSAVERLRVTPYSLRVLQGIISSLSAVEQKASELLPLALVNCRFYFDVDLQRTDSVNVI